MVYGNPIHGTQPRDEICSLCRRKHRTIGTLIHKTVRRNGDYKHISQRFRRLKMTEVANMEYVEATMTHGYSSLNTLNLMNFLS